MRRPTRTFGKIVKTASRERRKRGEEGIPNVETAGKVFLVRLLMRGARCASSKPDVNADREQLDTQEEIQRINAEIKNLEDKKATLRVAQDFKFECHRISNGIFSPEDSNTIQNLAELKIAERELFWGRSLGKDENNKLCCYRLCGASIGQFKNSVYLYLTFRKYNPLIRQ